MEGIKAARPDWLRDGNINIVVQLAPQKMPEVPADVPLVKDYVPDADDTTRARRDVHEHHPGAALYRAARTFRPTAGRRCATPSWRP